MQKKNFQLNEYNTFNIAAETKLFFAFSSQEELIDFIKNNKSDNLPCFVLGGGSNVLFTEDYQGCVIHPQNKGIRIIKETDEDVLVEVEAGENWQDFVAFCVNKGWSGIENLAYIPGNAGAAAVQNIGAYGVELKDVFEKLDAVYLSNGTAFQLNKEECAFGYRDSVFKNSLANSVVVTRLSIRLSKIFKPNISYGGIQNVLLQNGTHQPNLTEVFDCIVAIRKAKLPDVRDIGSAGSFFKNPVLDLEQFNEFSNRFPEAPHYPFGNKIKLAAGWLIDQCGWKGFRRNDAGVYPHQALVLVNYGAAKGKEILQLSLDIRDSVRRKFGVELEPEVIIPSQQNS